MNIINKLQKDFSGYIFKAFRNSSLDLKRKGCTFKMRIILYLKGIKLGKNSSFYGKSYFFRHPESKIHIGNCCTFISDSKYNLAGINRRCTISTMNKNSILLIGNNTGVSGAVISSGNHITIGNNVKVGANSFISDHDWHNIDPEKRDSPDIASSPIVIEDNVWLGLNVVVLKGVKIGKNSVIGANSLVNKSIPANVLAGGIPCRVIKEI